MLLNITGGPNLSLIDVNEASKIITDAVDPDATIIFGASIDENMGDTIRVTVIATGIDDTNGGSIKAPKPAPFTKPETPQSRFTKAAEKEAAGKVGSFGARARRFRPGSAINKESFEVTLMKCPFCSYADSRVIDSRSLITGLQSDASGVPGMWAPFHDLRKYEETPLLVIKKDGRRELFDSQKLTNGLLKAFEKRPFSYEQIQSIASGIERDLRALGESEVKSTLIGETVMKHWKRLTRLPMSALLLSIVNLLM